MAKQLNGSIKWVLGIFALVGIATGWMGTWTALSKDVETNSGLIAEKVDIDVYEVHMKYIKEKLKILIDGQTTLGNRIDKKHD